VLDGGGALEVAMLEAVLEVTLPSSSMGPKSMWERENLSEALEEFTEEFSCNIRGAGAGAIMESDRI
jgi:hypothetical protein